MPAPRPVPVAVFLGLCVVLSGPGAPLDAQGSRRAGAEPAALVLQTDFGLADGSVAAMKGVATGVSAGLRIHDLTHLIPPFNVWEGAVRLRQAVPNWPAGTVFVSVIDPGVGTARRSVVARTRGGQYVVTPDNGTLSFLADALGLEAVREIDERAERLPGSERSHSFAGRDIFTYVGARLAAGQLRFEQIGRPLEGAIQRLRYEAPRYAGEVAVGGIVALDGPFGNVWTNIPVTLLDRLGLRLGDTAAVRIFSGTRLAYTAAVPFVRSFGFVRAGEPLLYLNSVLEAALALNQGNFAERFKVQPGEAWRVEIGKRR